MMPNSQKMQISEKKKKLPYISPKITMQIVETECFDFLPYSTQKKLDSLDLSESKHSNQAACTIRKKN